MKEALQSSVGLGETPQELAEAIATVGERLVGHLDLKAAQRELRRAMSQVALNRTGGSRRAAAGLLGIDRRYVQRLIADFGQDRDEDLG